MKKTEKKIVFYTDDITSEDLQEAKELLAEDDGYTSAEDVPEADAWEEARRLKEFDFDDLQHNLAQYIKQNDLLIVGTCGRWNGRYKAGAFVCDIMDLWEGLRHCDYLEVYEVNGHLYIDGIHHDGRDSFEVKRLTQKGVDLAARYGWEHDQDLHNTIASNNIYSGLPHFSKFVFGC